MSEKTFKTIAKNKKAHHDYFVLESTETGIELRGTEVKSIRRGGANLKDSWCCVNEGELFANGIHIAPYSQGNIFNVDAKRPRKLLAHKKEINKFLGQTKEKGLSLIPLSMYFKGQKIKLQIGLCKGKKIYDKRADAAKKDAQRDMERAFREINK